MSSEPMTSVVRYRDWHRRVMLNQPLPYALGALFVMYGNSKSQSERVDALIEPYRIRQDLIVDGATMSRSYTERVWDEIYTMLTRKERSMEWSEVAWVVCEILVAFWVGFRLGAYEERSAVRHGLGGMHEYEDH